MKIIVFGSFADGTEGPESDLDLLVVLPQVDDKIEAMLSLRKATAHIPVPLDVIPTDPMRSPAAVMSSATCYVPHSERGGCCMSDQPEREEGEDGGVHAGDLLDE